MGHVADRAPTAALLPALGRLDQLLHAVGQAEPGPASIVAGPPDEPPSRLTELGDALGLEPFDLDLLALALAPELDRRYGALFAALAENPFATRPTPEIAVALLCPGAGERLARRARLGAGSPLVALDLVRLTPLGAAGASGPTMIELAPRVRDHLFDEAALEPRLVGIARTVQGEAADAESAAVTAFAALTRPGVLVLEGPAAAGGVSAAAAVAACRGRQLLVVDLDRFGSSGRSNPDAIALAVREAALSGGMLCLATAAEAPAFDELGPSIGFVQEPVIVTAADARALDGTEKLDVLVVRLSPPGTAGRAALWRQQLGGAAEGTDVDALASRFRLGAEQIAGAARSAARTARVRAAGGGEAQVIDEDLFAAARGQCGAELAGLARKLDSTHGFDDIVLPEDSIAQLREICTRIEQRDRVIDGWGFRRTLGSSLGVSALFAGSSGTGKTMAAGVLARTLGLDLHAIQLATIVDKYIGETSKNLDRTFRAAHDANAILFFDEADALFGKRSEVRDAHDRYANVEIAYLLQRMEAYDGVAILATNLRQNLDDAFVRRLAFTVHFPFPDAEARLRIWERVWPTEVGLGDDVDLDDLARRFRLSGGNIRNAAVAAAFLAAGADEEICREHLLFAIRREYQKLGRGLTEAELTGEEPALAGAAQ